MRLITPLFVHHRDGERHGLYTPLFGYQRKPDAALTYAGPYLTYRSRRSGAALDLVFPLGFYNRNRRTQRSTLFTLPGLDFPVRILPLIMGASMFVQQKMMPQTGMDPVQARMMLIMMPGMILTLISGLYLWLEYGFSGGWLHAKLTLVALLIGYHFWCGATIKLFLNDNSERSHKFYRVVNELPVIVLIAIVILVVVKPF